MAQHVRYNTMQDLRDMLAGKAVTIVGDTEAPPDEISPVEELLARIKRLAKAQGWRGEHTRDARGPGSGLQCLLVREALIIATLLSDRQKLSQSQHVWQDALRRTGAVEVYTWTPRLWPEIEARLTRPKGL